MSKDKLGVAVVPIRATMDKLDEDLSQARGKIQRATGRMSQTLKTIGKAAVVGITGATVAVAGLGAAMTKLAFDAMPLEGIQKAFDGITGGADDTLRALRKGSLGMVRDAELMRQYNEATQLVSKSFADDLPDAMGYLQKVSAATKQDMGFLIQSLTTGIGRLQPLILDNLSIQVNATKAYDDYAASIGKSVDELTKQEQQTALMNQVMELLAENTKDMPDIADNAATKWAQLRTIFGNLKDEIGLGLLPLFTPLLSKLVELTQVWAPKLSDLITNRLIPKVKDLVTEFGALAKGISEAFQEGGLIGLGEHLATELGEVWSTHVGPVLMDWGGRFWDWIADPTVGAIAMATDKLGLLVTEFDNWIADNESKIADLGVEIGEDIGNAIQSIFGDKERAEGSVMVLIGNLATTIGRLSGKLNQLGGLIGAHIIKGIMSSFGVNISDNLVNSLIYALSGPIGQMIRLQQMSNMQVRPLGILGFQSGGLVPGPIGAPQLAVVHGGEMVLPAGSWNTHHTFEFPGYDNMSARIREGAEDALLNLLDQYNEQVRQ